MTALGMTAGHVRFSVSDVAGNVATSPPHALAEAPTRDILLPLILR